MNTLTSVPKTRTETVSNTKICKSGAECVNGPDPQPIENFQKSAIVKSGRLGVCKDCMSVRRKAGILKAVGRRLSTADKKPPDVSVPDSAGAPLVYDPHTLHIDFSGREDLLDELKKVAQKNLRTIKAQALWFIICGVSGHNWMPERAAE